MPSLNKIRLNNIRYNQNKTIIRDITFDLHGATTLMNLDNGGGKTVISQLCHAPYLRGKNRNFGKRKFDDLFMTSSPSFVIHEWQMDDEAGIFIVGMLMARTRSASAGQDYNDQTRVAKIAFIEEVPGDIHQSIIESFNLGENNHTFTFTQAVEYLKQLNKDKSRTFRYYNLETSMHRNDYFQRLKELGIYESQWIQMRNFNQEESGIAKFAEQYPTKTRLMDDVLINAVESKLEANARFLGKNDTAMNIITDNIKMYATNLEEHKEDLKNYNTYADFLAFMDTSDQQAEKASEAITSVSDQQNLLKGWSSGLFSLIQTRKADQLKTDQLRLATLQEKKQLLSQQISWKWHLASDRKNKLASEKEAAIQQQILLETKEAETIHEQNLQTCASSLAQLNQTSSELEGEKTRWKAVKADQQEAQKNLAYYAGGLYDIYQEKSQNTRSALDGLSELIAGQEKSLKEARDTRKKLNKNLFQISGQIATASSQLEHYDQKEADLAGQLDIKITRQMEPYVHFETITRLAGREKRKADEAGIAGRKLKKESVKLKQEREDCRQAISQKNAELGSARQSLQQLTDRKEEYEAQKENRFQIAHRFVASEEAANLLWDTEKLLSHLGKHEKELKAALASIAREIYEKEQENDNLKTGSSTHINQKIREAAQRQGTDLVFVSAWMRDGKMDLNQAEEYIRKFPLLPYSLIMSRSQKEALLKELSTQNIHTEQILPIIVREDLEHIIRSSADADVLNRYFYASFNTVLLDKDRQQEMIQKNQEKIQELKNRQSNFEQEIEQDQQDIRWLKNTAISLKQYNQLMNQLESAQNQVESLHNLLTELDRKHSQMQHKIQEVDDLIRQKEKDEDNFSRRAQSLVQLEKDCRQARSTYQNKLALEKQQTDLSNQLQQTENQIESLQEQQQSSTLKREQARTELASDLKQMKMYEMYKENPEKAKGSLESLIEQYNAWRDDPSLKDLDRIEQKIQTLSQQQSRQQEELDENLHDMNLELEEVQKVKADFQLERQLRKEIKELRAQIKKVTTAITDLAEKIGTENAAMKFQEDQLQEMTGLTEVIPKEQIVQVDWPEEIRQKDILIEECDKEFKALEKLIHNLERQKDTLNEKVAVIDFSHRSIPDIQLAGYDLKTIERKVVELKHELDRRQEKRIQTIDEARRQIDLFLPDIPNGFENLLEIARSLKEYMDSPDSYLQASTHSREIITRNLERIQSSRDKIMALKNESIKNIYDHIYQIYEQIKQIDSNTIIEIHGTRGKMLEITLPRLEEEEEGNRQKIDVFVEETAAEIIARNHDESYIMKRITPQNLFALIVPSSSIRIRVRKVELNSSEMINWEKVIVLSGGESFMTSCAVILALLYYQRIDATGGLTGKVPAAALFMDNPFAYVQSDHILGPLMALLKKTKTQMIALSKVENASIIGSFSNIYFMYLKLFADQKQHLIAEHTKGNESSVMMDSIRLHEEPEDETTVDPEDLEDADHPAPTAMFA